MKTKDIITAAFALLIFGASSGAAAQLAYQIGALPPLGIPKVEVPVSLPDGDLATASQLARTLEQARVDRLTDFVRSNRDVVELDGARQAAVKGVLIATGVDDAAVAKAIEAGFILSSREEIEGLDLAYARFVAPAGTSLKDAEKALRKLLPETEIDADNIYFASGQTPALATGMLASATVKNASLGLIDSGVADHPSLSGRVEQKGFATGAPKASSHGTSVAALMVGSGSVRGGSPGASMLAADVYGTDKAGGNASAIARALGWLATRNVAIVTISLVGPDNALLRKAVSSAQAKGLIIVAAVGNDGPASPAVYPASYPGVIAVTGVDSKNLVLPEAGRASHTDFAAPGAGISSATSASGIAKVRGTSYAAPLVAGRLARYYPRPSVAQKDTAIRKLISEAIDLGKKGRDAIFGDGLVCSTCIAR